MEKLDSSVASSIKCEYKWNCDDQLEIKVEPCLTSNYYTGMELSLKSVFMQPYYHHSNFLFHEEFDDQSLLDISCEIGDYLDDVEDNHERASFTQATNVPWTLEVQSPSDPETFDVNGVIYGPDKQTSNSKINCATPLTIDLSCFDY